MRTIVRSMFAMTMLIITMGSLTGCAEELLGPPSKAWVVFSVDIPEVINATFPDGKTLRMGPGDQHDFYAQVSVESQITWSYPDGRSGRTIKFSPDAELRDADGPDGQKADTWVYASGRVIR